MELGKERGWVNLFIVVKEKKYVEEKFPDILVNLLPHLKPGELIGK